MEMHAFLKLAKELASSDDSEQSVEWSSSKATSDIEEDSRAPIRRMASDKALLLFAVAAACVVGAADAKFGRLGRLVITGVVPCNTGSLIDIATSPAFPNADVELRCAGKVVAGATTNTNGTFSMELDMTNALAAFIGGCTLVVDTPLIKCNADLTDVGSLVSYLQGPLTRLLGGIFHLFPAGFSFHARRA